MRSSIPSLMAAALLVSRCAPGAPRAAAPPPASTRPAPREARSRLPEVVPSLNASQVRYDDLDADRVQVKNLPVITTCGRFIGILSESPYQSAHTGVTETYRTLQLYWIRVSDSSVLKILPLLERDDAYLHSEVRAGACHRNESPCDPRIGQPQAALEAKVAARYTETLKRRTEAIRSHLAQYRFHALLPVPAHDAKIKEGAGRYRLWFTPRKGAVQFVVKPASGGRVLAEGSHPSRSKDFLDFERGYAEAWLSEPLGILLVKIGGFDIRGDRYEGFYRVIRIKP